LIILIIFGEQYKLRSSSLCSFLQPPITSYFFGPNIFLSTLFSNTLSLCSSLNVRDQVSTGRLIILQNLMFTIFDSRQEDKRFWTEWQQALPEFNLLLISSWNKFWFVIVVPYTLYKLKLGVIKYLKMVHHSEERVGLYGTDLKCEVTQSLFATTLDTNIDRNTRKYT
jgi:hypothetical protein